MKKTYMKPTSEAMRLGLQGEDIAESVVISSGTADPDVQVLSKGERDWDDSSNFWGD